ERRKVVWSRLGGHQHARSQTEEQFGVPAFQLSSDHPQGTLSAHSRISAMCELNSSTWPLGRKWTGTSGHNRCHRCSSVRCLSVTIRSKRCLLRSDEIKGVGGVGESR